MSSITIEELKKLPAESYQIIDVRDEIEISHGAVKGALACKPEEIMENPEVDTIFLTTSLQYSYLSSTIVKEFASYGGDISKFVPARFIDRIYEKYHISK